MNKIYLAGPVFTLAEKTFNKTLAVAIETTLSNVEVILPQERAPMFITKPNGFKLTFDDCLLMIDESYLIIAILDGADADSGTCFEIGYAYNKKPIIGVRTDLRACEENGLNLMLSNSCNPLIVDMFSDMETVIKKIIHTVRKQLES